jgi:AbrB family looped-hinge helix DNA binding protein
MSVAMPLVKIKTKGQITLPKQVRDALGLSDGDLIEVDVRNGRGVILPKQSVAAPASKLSPKEQQTLRRARKRIAAINEDMIHSRGLTREEADAAAKAGLIDPDQIWFWLEGWQKGERKAERDDQEGRFKEFSSAEAFLQHLDSLKSRKAKA